MEYKVIYPVVCRADLPGDSGDADALIKSVNEIVTPSIKDSATIFKPVFFYQFLFTVR